MPYLSALDSAAARNAIQQGDMREASRYLREGGSNPVQNITGTTGTLIPGTNTINVATGGSTLLLPVANGSQNHVRIVVGTAISSGNVIIKTATNADFMTGSLTHAIATFGAASAQAVGGTNALITLTATSGGVKGTVITFTDIAPNLWLVQGTINSSTVGANVGAWA